VLPGLVLELLELGLFWPYAEDVLAWPLPVEDVSVEEPVVPGEAEPLAEPCMPLVEPCVLVPVLEVFEPFDAVRVSFCDPEHAASSAAAPSAVTR
jgi:hypothetical protein